ncbi:MAG TPA: anti-sigma factor [Terriglobia bacterium]|nr:anti-sigma factor [Terriglobia bacterium]
MNAHPQYDEDFELYELGVLDGKDRAEFKTHVAGCAECRPKIEAARSHVALFALAAPPSEPRPEVRERLLETFRARRPQRLQGAPSVPARRRPWTPVWAWAGVCVILLAVAIWAAINNLRLSKRVAELELSHQQLVTSNLELDAKAARAQAVLDLLTGPQTIQVELSPATAHPVPHGKAFYNRDKGLLFYTMSLHSLPTNHIYELWLIPTVGKPVDIGIFNTDTQGNGQLILTALPQGLTAKAFAVTIEPAGGVPAPSGPMVLVGPVS